MRPGIVVTIRVNPQDCMAVVDVMDKVGINTDGMSFPQMVSLTLSSLLQTARNSGTIPTRTGFEYNEMVGRYHGSQRSKRKLDVTNAIASIGSDFAAPAIPTKPQIREAVFESTMSIKDATIKLTELLHKRDTDEPWTVQDQAAYDEAYRIVYPDG